MQRLRLLLLLPWLGIIVLFSSSAALRGWSAAPPPATAQGDEYEDALDKAKLNYNRRNYEEALKFYKRANKLKGENCTVCLWGMAQTYSKLGADKNVVETCERLAQVAAGDRDVVARALNLKGISLVSMAMVKMEKPDLKKLAEAEAAFRKALETEPDTTIVHYNLGITLLRLNREAEGIKELKLFVEDAGDESESAGEARKIIANPRRARENFAPDFSFTTSDGEFIDSDDLRGKVVLVDFWGTWCPPCRESIPALASLAKRFAKESFSLISVDVGDEPDNWRTFIEKNKMSWPQLQDRTGKVQRSFQVRSFPTYVLIDHEGVIRYRSTGYSDYVEGMIADAIKKSLKTAAKAGPPKAQAALPPAPPRDSIPDAVPVAGASQPSPPAQQSELKPPGELPSPVIEVTGAEVMDAGGIKITRFYLSVKNWSEYPDVFFAPMPGLPPCSFNTTPTRIQVIVWSEDVRPLTTYCNVPDSSLLRRLQVMIRTQDATASARVYVTIEDRRVQRTLKSNLVPLVAPAAKAP